MFEKNLIPSKNSKDLVKNFENLKNELLKIFLSKDDLIEKLVFSNKKLGEINDSLKKKVINYEEEHNKEKFCIHCHSTFIPKFNEEVTF